MLLVDILVLCEFLLPYLVTIFNMFLLKLRDYLLNKLEMSKNCETYQKKM